MISKSRRSQGDLQVVAKNPQDFRGMVSRTEGSRGMSPMKTQNQETSGACEHPKHRCPPLTQRAGTPGSEAGTSFPSALFGPEMLDFPSYHLFNESSSPLVLNHSWLLWKWLLSIRRTNTLGTHFFQNWAGEAIKVWLSWMRCRKHYIRVQRRRLLLQNHQHQSGVAWWK